MNDINEFRDVICTITIYADDTTLCSKCDQASDLWQQLEVASEPESDEVLRTRATSRLQISMLKKLNLFPLTGLITLVRLLVILIGCMIFLSPFLDVTKITMLTFSYLAQFDSGFSTYRKFSFYL